eukprot:7900686-Heterocapsa_arctica.AAC.1
MRMTQSEAMDVIKQEQIIADQDTMDTEMRINIVMEFEQFNTEERAAFKLFKRCDIRDIASYLNSMKCIDRVEGNGYTIAGQGTYTEHP